MSFLFDWIYRGFSSVLQLLGIEINIHIFIHYHPIFAIYLSLNCGCGRLSRDLPLSCHYRLLFLKGL